MVGLSSRIWPRRHHLWLSQVNLVHEHRLRREELRERRARKERGGLEQGKENRDRNETGWERGSAKRSGSRERQETMFMSQFMIMFYFSQQNDIGAARFEPVEISGRSQAWAQANAHKSQGPCPCVAHSPTPGPSESCRRRSTWTQGWRSRGPRLRQLEA